ncbi:MAG: adenine nucleotide alpha hydrolase [Verrucomicrobiales bacterium]|nr:adenine nucleotide alpha hydrolase [Verrucomicrobiales bacterium]
MGRERIVLGWSGGKDSSLALRKILAEGRLEVAALLTTCTEGFLRVSMHGVRCSLLNRQAEALGLPCRKVFIPQNCTNDEYERLMRAACLDFKATGITQVAFGDLFLEDIRAYRDRMLAEIGMTALYSVWGLDTRELAREFIRDGFRATLVCVDSAKLDGSFAGRAYDQSLLTDLPANTDPCGENGEFHTFVHGGPIFRHPVACRVGSVVQRGQFHFADLLPGTTGSRRNKQRKQTTTKSKA